MSRSLEALRLVREARGLLEREILRGPFNVEASRILDQFDGLEETLGEWSLAEQSEGVA